MTKKEPATDPRILIEELRSNVMVMPLERVPHLAHEVADALESITGHATFAAEERDAAIEDLRRSKQALKEWRERCKDLQDEAEEARKALEGLKKVSRLAWLGWINKKSDFAARMLRMKEQCESDS